MKALTLSWNPGNPLVYIFCCVYMYFSFAIVNQAHNAFEVGDFNQAYQKPLSNQAYHSSEVGTFTQAYQETVIKPRLSTIWGEKLKPDLPGNPGKTRPTRLLRWKISTRLTKHLGKTWVTTLSRKITTRLSIFLVYFQKPGKSCFTMVYQAHQVLI